MPARIYVSAASTFFFLQNMMCSNGSICAMKSVPGREQFKTAGCHSCQLKAKSSWRLAVSESQTDNRHMNTVNCNNTSKEHDSTAVLDLPSDCCDHCCPLLWPLLRTECSETAASARWSRYLAENNSKQRAVISLKKRRRHHEDSQFQNQRLILHTWAESAATVRSKIMAYRSAGPAKRLRQVQ